MKSRRTSEPERFAPNSHGRSSESTSAKLAPGRTGRDDRFSGGGITEVGGDMPGEGNGRVCTGGPPGMLTAGGFHGNSPVAVLSGRTPGRGSLGKTPIGGGTPAGPDGVEPGMVAGIEPGAEPAPG